MDVPIGPAHVTVVPGKHLSNLRLLSEKSGHRNRKPVLGIQSGLLILLQANRDR